MEYRMNDARQKRTMIIGAGDACKELLWDIARQDSCSLDVVCIIDDNQAKVGTLVEGVPVVGNRKKILTAVSEEGIDLIIFAIPSASIKQRQELLQICKETECKLQTLPSLSQLVDPDASIRLVREVNLEDLLGRELSQANGKRITEYLSGKVVLVTGGGGSIGGELCRQIARANPSRLILLDIYENSAYDIQQELREAYPKLDLVVLIGSVRNTLRVDSIMKKYCPDIIYHAAAHKHVPLMEDSPHEAIKNNVFGTYNMAVMADRYHCKRFVLISTDKAVNPTNIMGASKRICELIIQSMDAKSGTDYVAVRFGNVLGSNGSVIPLFKKQIDAGGPVTVTHPDINRFFMTISEAVSLVLEAGADAQGGEIFVLDMGEPVKIADMAENLIRLSGFRPGQDIQIQYTGLRPGEKLYEEIMMDDEDLRKTSNNRIYIAKPLELNVEMFYETLEKLKEIAYDEESDIRGAVKGIVPEYAIREEEE